MKASLNLANLVIFIWLSGLTLLLFFILSSLNTLIELQSHVPASTARLLEKKHPTTSAQNSPECKCNPVTCPVPPPATPCPPVKDCPAPVQCSPCSTVPVSSASCSECPACDKRPRRVKPILRWLNMDGGRDFFKVLTEGNKAAQKAKALVVEVGVGDGRQAIETATLGYTVISIDGSRKALGQGKNSLRAVTKNNTIPLSGNITWIHSAVGDSSGNVTFYDYGRGIGRMLDDNNTDAVTHKDNPKWKGGLVTVPLNKLDDLVARTPYILKIDVEGHELPVLRGASRMLSQRPPIVILEFNPAMMNWSAHSDALDALNLLHDYGYDLYDASISEPAKKGFVQKYGSYHRPTEYPALVSWLKLSARWDWWGAWTDIVALQPQQDTFIKTWP